MNMNYVPPEGFDCKKENEDVYGTIRTICYDSAATGKKRYASVLLPADYNSGRKYPVLYLLHGISGDHREWLEGNPVNIIGNLKAEGKVSDMIVVMPNVRARAKDAGDPEDLFTLEHFAAFDNFINDLRDDLMPYIKDQYSIAEGRQSTAIAGLSMGGREALFIGLSMPDTFGFIGAFEPAWGVLPYNDRNGVSEGGLFTADTLKLPDEYNNRTFLMIVKGTDDTTVGEAPLYYHRALKENGTVHTYYEVEGGHDFSVWKNGLYHFVSQIF